MDASSNQQIAAGESTAPATFSHPRGYIDQDGHYAIWVGTPPGIDPGQVHQETSVTGTDFTPEQWLEGLDDEDFVTSQMLRIWSKDWDSDEDQSNRANPE
jgi:hypothetical protein